MHFVLSAFSFKNINQLCLNQEPSGFGNMFANAESRFSKGLPPLWPGLYYFISYPTPIALPIVLQIHLQQEEEHSIQCNNLESLVCVFR